MLKNSYVPNKLFAMKKQEVIDAVAGVSGQSKALVRQVLAAAVDVTRDAISRHEDVFLFGLGKLSVTRRGPKKSRHMVSGEPMIVPARDVVVYRPSDSVAEAAALGTSA